VIDAVVIDGGFQEVGVVFEPAHAWSALYLALLYEQNLPSGQI
jgi:hypothetical protein